MLGTGNYLVAPGETDTAILTAMVHQFDAQATKAGLSASSASALGLTPYQVITAASIVEKEGYIPKNMPQVARVIYNRLAAGTPLQMNATVLYSLGQDGGAVTSADLKLQTPYNTYLHVGLTPTPICSPSPDALAAAVHPPAGSWLYFVVVKKGRHRGLLRHVRRATGQREVGPAARGGVMAAGVPGPGWTDARTTVVGVMGDPVRHSLSPLLHNAAFAALGLNWISVGFAVAAGNAAAALDGSVPSAWQGSR